MNVTPGPAEDDELVLVATESMRARRAPGAVLCMWALHALLAALCAWPFASAVASTFGSHPQGDAPLWRAGGAASVDFLLGWWTARRALVPLPMLALASAALLGLLPVALVLAQTALATRARRTARIMQLLPRALAAFGPLAAVLLVATVVELVVAGAALGMGEATADLLHQRMGEARSQQVGIVVALAASLMLGAAAVVHDLARAAIVRFQIGAWRGIRLALNTFLRAPLALYGAWAWRAAIALGLVGIGSMVVERAGDRRGTFLVVMALHQVIILARVALRASWLARALRGVDLAYRVVRRSTSTPIQPVVPASGLR